MIALTNDQVQAMTERNVKTVYAGEVDYDTRTEADIDRYLSISASLLSPETLFENDRWRDILVSPAYQQNLVRLVIDEAHCIKKW